MASVLTDHKRDAGKVSLDIDHVLRPGMDTYERGQRLRKRVISVDPQVCIERARFVTDAYRDNEGKHVLVQRAEAFDRIMRGISVYILSDELVVGHMASTQRSAPLFPEFAVEWVNEELETFETRPQDRFIVPDEVKREFREYIYPYWKGKTLHDRLMSYITEEIRLQRFVATVFSVGLHEDGGLGHVALDYEKVLLRGLGGIKEEISGYMAGLSIWNPEDYRKKLFYEACIRMCDSVIHFAHRHARIARELAAEEQDAKRREELLRVAEICERVPEHHASTFHEALQSFWFVQIVPQIYDNGVSISPGRFDQYMYPFYTRDIESLPSPSSSTGPLMPRFTRVIPWGRTSASAGWDQTAWTQRTI